jgi:hypothetical protein
LKEASANGAAFLSPRAKPGFANDDLAFDWGEALKARNSTQDDLGRWIVTGNTVSSAALAGLASSSVSG